MVLGTESSDARMGALAAMLAERLSVPQLSLSSKVEIDGSAVRIHWQSEDGYQVVEGALPAVVGLVEKINEPRYPSFKGIMAAKKKPVARMSLAEAGIDPARVGLANAATEVVDFAARPPRQVGTIVKDEGDGGKTSLPNPASLRPAPRRQLPGRATSPVPMPAAADRQAAPGGPHSPDSHPGEADMHGQVPDPRSLIAGADPSARRTPLFANALRHNVTRSAACRPSRRAAR